MQLTCECRAHRAFLLNEARGSGEGDREMPCGFATLGRLMFTR